MMTVKPPTSPGRARWLRAVLLAAVAGLLAVPAMARGKDVPNPEWREGPVRYLLTRQENQVYKGLKTDEARRRFITQFWRRRDPTPETPINEFRDVFWRRVQKASDLFTDDTPFEGWISDRGKIFILLGPPSEMVNEQVSRSHRGIILWIYRSTWSKQVGPNFVVAFAKDPTGSFRISTAPSTDANVFRGLQPNTPVHLRGAGDATGARVRSGMGIGDTDPYLVAQGMPSGLTELAMLADLGQLQQTDHLIINEFVSSQALFGNLPVIATADFYKANNETTYVAITVSIRSKSLQFRERAGREEPDLSVYGRLELPKTGDLVHSFEKEEDFVPSPDNPQAGVNDYLTFQAGAGIPPGRYMAKITVHDRVAEKIGTYELELEVPDFAGERLALSSVTLAERLQPLKGTAPSELKKPYVFGSFLVVPKPGVAYAIDQEFAFYFQSYNARTDSESGRPLLDVAYVFEARDLDDGQFKPFGSPLELPGQAQAALGFSFPLTEWPIGQYRLRVQVTDRLDGGTAERAVDFLVR